VSARGDVGDSGVAEAQRVRTDSVVVWPVVVVGRSVYVFGSPVYLRRSGLGVVAGSLAVAGTSL
jgi:hypothetical protein